MNYQISDNLIISYGADAFSYFFLILVTFMWTMSGIFSTKYKEHMDHNPRFYLFFFTTYAALISLAFSANYLTMYMSFEFVTIFSMPLVLHMGTRDAIYAAKKYLLYSIFGAMMGLVGFFFMTAFGDTSFAAGGNLDAALAAGHEGTLLTAALISIMGFGVKSGMFPLHGWLPTAHPVAPAPAHTLLSSIVTKAGVLCIIRVMFYQFGADFLRGTWVQTVLICLSLTTVLLGSVLALKQDLTKKRLAYSSVSQVSYVLFGLFVMNRVSVTGALLHILYHAIIKGTLFLCIGSIIFMTDLTRVSELRGIGKKMPKVMTCYTVASLGLVGIPPFAGFMSKWYLAIGSLESGSGFLSWAGPVSLIVSALFTALYLFPLSINGFLPRREFEDVETLKEPWQVWLPVTILAAAIVLTGLFADPLIALFSNIAEVMI